MPNMRITYRPKTIKGIWSVRLILASVLFFILFFAVAASGQTGGDTFFSNLALAIPMLVAALSAVASFFTGIIAIIRNRERATFVYLSTTLGFLVLL